jgi:hypothetical protein
LHDEKELQLRQEGKVIVMTKNEKVHLTQFESVLTRIRMSKKKVKGMMTKNQPEESELRQEDQMIPMMNNKVPVPQFSRVSSVALTMPLRFSQRENCIQMQ